MNHHQAHQALRHADGWRKSSHSQGSDACVEITTAIPGWVGVRDSKLAPHSPTLAFTHDEWRALLAAARTGEFDV
jgi:hypothetical protein